ncbi:uncharacterized protein K452DRAFT_359363 [Aplosporella prunicola CBS 121167]|uniref:Uncharacterized protein n=1 Tax=Aplosporella prunicola CBS 121167 TaxID=1176127 RepID=A0A6A6BEP2_9PEZI|nr:uncharacterized protein K452DRAFT_359363 [Aplosporella prunicola CBS 121167]KAF2140941.1 hypothetical protein K452DRAFT_359363 [Aplosporella prunicola CBS 121167]
MVYPERLLIYNAGAGRTAYIGFFKLVTIFIFAGGCLIVAPAVYYDPNSAPWKMPAVLLASTIPMLAISTTTAPFVNSIFLYLPPKARTSQEALLRYARALPPTTRLDLATVSFRGSAKTSGCQLRELRSMPGKRWGIANIERVAVAAPAEAKPAKPTPVDGILKAAQGEGVARPLEKKQKGSKALRRFVELFNEPRNRFYIDPERGSGRSRAPGVVQLVVEQIERNGGGKIHL